MLRVGCVKCVVCDRVVLYERQRDTDIDIDIDTRRDTGQDMGRDGCRWRLKPI